MVQDQLNQTSAEKCLPEILQSRIFWHFTELQFCFGLFFPLLPKASRIVGILPVDVITPVPAPFACSKSLEFPSCTDSPWLPG